MIGSKLGNWIVEKELGSGGMGHVYLARKDAAGPLTYAAVKVLAPELAREAGFRQRFEREIEALGQLAHPNIVRFYEAGEQDGRYYYVMEYVRGQDFDHIVAEQGRLDWQLVLDVALQLAPALKHAHDRGVIHRDLKPHNLLRAEDGTVKLTDFGIAKVFAGKQLTTTGSVIGTAEYMAPELAMGKPATPRSDLYSLGVVMYVLLTGRPPFDGGSVPDLLHKHRFAQFDRPRRYVPAIPPELDRLVCQLLEKDPEDRPANGLALQRQLEAVRRRAERREQQTEVVSSNLPTQSDPDDEPDKLPGPATLMSRWVRKELEDQNRGGPIARIFNRPVVLIVLFIACVGILVWRLWFKPAPDPEALFREGSRLMTSDNPTDWDRAWNKYLEPLNREFPRNPHHEEVERLHEQMQDRAQLNRALAGLKTTQATGEAERFYRRGLERCRQGEPDEARAIWQAMLLAFGDDPAQERWVKLAREGLSRLDAERDASHRYDQVHQEVARARTLRRQGHIKEADQVLQGLAELYRSDPEARRIIEQARKSGKQ